MHVCLPTWLPTYQSAYQRTYPNINLLTYTLSRLAIHPSTLVERQKCWNRNMKIMVDNSVTSGSFWENKIILFLNNCLIFYKNKNKSPIACQLNMDVLYSLYFLFVTVLCLNEALSVTITHEHGHFLLTLRPLFHCLMFEWSIIWYPNTWKGGFFFTTLLSLFHRLMFE